MGQYFTAVVELDGKPKGFESVEPGGLKLMEHSWFKNGYVNAVAKMLFGEPHKVAWVGDYAAGETTEEIYSAGHVNEVTMLQNENEFDLLTDIYLVNHDKKLYLDCTLYYMSCDGKCSIGKGWVPHPLPLLTAVGNGNGGGDYSGVNQEEVGAWAWDTISVEVGKDIPQGYTEYFVEFYE